MWLPTLDGCTKDCTNYGHRGVREFGWTHRRGGRSGNRFGIGWRACRSCLRRTVRQTENTRLPSSVSDVKAWSQKPISRVLFRETIARGPVVIIPLVRMVTHGIDSGQPGDVRRATFSQHGDAILSLYAALLRVGFAVPHSLPNARWAFTPPFHPYVPDEPGARFVFCGTFLEVALTGGYPAPCPVELGLSSRLSADGHLFF